MAEVFKSFIPDRKTYSVVQKPDLNSNIKVLSAKCETKLQQMK